MANNYIIIIYDPSRYHQETVMERLLYPFTKSVIDSASSPISYPPLNGFKIKGSPSDLQRFAKSKKIGLERIVSGVYVLRSLNTARKENSDPEL